MLDLKIIKEISGERGISEIIIEKDYVLDWLLWSLSQIQDLKANLIFKGATALHKTYFNNWRFSEDLDFTTPKPKHFIKEIIDMATLENDLILDPFIGSGSTAVATKQLNRKFIGFEIRKEYCLLADKRLTKIKEGGKGSILSRKKIFSWTYQLITLEKFRFKKRENRLDFGETFSTREGAFDDQTYLEWQIGYDVPVNDVEKGTKSTKLTSKHFIGSNGKKKYPYELSELFYEAMMLEFISKKEVENLCTEIDGYKNFIDEKAISVEHHAKLTINGMNFEETSIKLPTLYMIETLDETQIEVSIQKQQYASGVQPMVYFCIPLKAFNNSSDLHGKSSNPGDKLVYVISKTNVLNLVYMMKVFGMASGRHKHDVVKILETLPEIIDR